MKKIKSFKDFIFKGNIIDLATGVIIGTAFGQIITSLVQNIIMPPINIILAKVNFTNWFIVLKNGQTAGPYLTLDEACKAGAITLNVGSFINSLSNFLIISICIYILLVIVNKIICAIESNDIEVQKATTKECKYCYSTIHIKATRCPNCTANLL